MPDFEAFFQAATGYRPYGYQARIARDGLPDLVRAPTGAGKTAIVLAWLWRRLHGPDPAGTPRRLFYLLPQRSLTEPVSGEVRTWLANLDLASEVSVHVARGSSTDSTGDWRENLHRPAIVVGDADLLVSKALNRGYGTGRALLPLDFALACNGAQWIVDEVALCPRAAATLRRLAELSALLGTAEPFRLTGLTAVTADGSPAASALTAAGSPAAGTPAATPATSAAWTVEITPADRADERAARLSATRTIRRAAVRPGDYPALAAFAAAVHRPGTLTLIAVDRGPAAQQVYRLLSNGPARCALLHSQLRGVERTARLAGVLARPADLILVAAGEAAAGLDLTASVVVTEAAPWPSLVRRAGRANRSGMAADAEMWWLPPPSPSPPPPPEPAAIDAACAELTRLEGRSVTARDLLACRVPAVPAPVALIGRADLAALFDTTSVRPDPAGGVERYVRDAGEPDVELAWVSWTAGEDGAPDPEVRFPAPEYRCRVPVSDALVLAASRPVWRFDPDAGEWQRVTRPVPLGPYDLLLVDAADGGYDPEAGFDPQAQARVPDSPQVLTPAELTARAARAVAAAVAAGEPVPALAPRQWQSLNEHSEQVRDQTAALLAVLRPAVSPAAAAAAIVGGYLHDTGKAHPVWQDALCALASAPDAAAAGRPWAKSGTDGRLEFAGGVAFRHELASLLLIDGPERQLLAASPDPDLTRYLVLAHHGLLRVQVRDRGPAAVPPDTGAPGAQTDDVEPGARELLGLRQGQTTGIPPLLGQPATTLIVDLGQFQPDGDRPWTGIVGALLGKYGPFILSYLETVVRVADWRASGGRELPEPRPA